MHNDSIAIGKQLIRGGITLSAARLATRVLSVASALTVPRWLGPAEMGIFAVAMLAINAINAFTESGFTLAFMQRKVDYEKYILPVRTVNTLRGFALGLGIYVAAPYVAAWMNVPRSVSLLRVLALAPVITGLMPMIWTLASKRLLFGYEAKYNVGMTVVSLAITIPLAWFLKNAWALVWGMLLSDLIGVVVSTLMSREGRGFTRELRLLKDLQGFGFWIFLTGIVSYLFINGGNWLIGRLLDVQILAVYTLAFKFSTMFTGEAGAIINQMMLPVFSHIQDDLPRLRTGFRKSFGILAMIVIGVGALFCVVSRDYFIIVLGGKWSAYTTLFNNLLPWLTLWGVCSAFAGAQSGVFQALSKPNWWMWTVVAMCALMLLFILPAVQRYGAVGVAAVLGGVAAAMQVVRYLLLARMLQLRVRQISAHVVVPGIAGVLAVTAATLGRGHLTTNPWGQAVMAMALVTTVYLGTLGALARFIYPNPIQLAGRAGEYARERLRGWRA